MHETALISWPTRFRKERKKKAEERNSESVIRWETVREVGCGQSIWEQNKFKEIECKSVLILVLNFHIT